jgi:glycosyltransferase involved in cell wall biosynthesis
LLASKNPFDLEMPLTEFNAAKWDPTIIIKFQKFLKKYKPSILHAHGVRAAPLALLTSNVPVIIHDGGCAIHTRDFGCFVMKQIMRLFKNKPAAVLACSNAVARGLLQLGLSVRAILPNPIDLDMFNPSRYSRDEARALMGNNRNGSIIVGYVGSIRKLKRLEFILDAIAIMPDRFKLVVIGEAWSETDRKLFWEGVSDRRLDNRVSVTGYVQNPARLMAGLDVAVQTSSIGAFGAAVIELMAMGVPVITPPVGAFPEIVIDCVTGCLSATPESTARSIKTLTCDYSFRNRLISRAKELATQYDYRRIAKRLLEIYISI